MRGILRTLRIITFYLYLCRPNAIINACLLEKLSRDSVKIILFHILRSFSLQEHSLLKSIASHFFDFLSAPGLSFRMLTGHS